MNYKKSNPIAKEVRTPKFKPQVVKPKKGKGSYKRQKTHNLYGRYNMVL